MSSYRCVVLLLFACMAACMDCGEAGTFRNILINVGENYTFNCSPYYNHNYDYYYDHFWYWSRLSYYISSLRDTSVRYHSYFQDRERVNPSYTNGYFSLTVLNMIVADSGYYDCKYYNRYSQMPWFDIVRCNARVIGCSCTVAQPYVLRSDSKTVTCTLDNYPPPSFGPMQTTISADPQISGTIQDDVLTFSTNNDLREDLTITFNPFTNVEGNISCVVPAAPMITTITQRTTSVTSSTEEPPTPPSTSYLPTRGYNRTSSQYPATVSQPYFSEEPFPDISKVTNPSKKACTGTTTTTLIVVESVMGLLLIVNVIISIRLCQKLKRAPTKSSPSRLQSRKEQVEVEETDMCYASISDTNQPAVYTNA